MTKLLLMTLLAALPLQAWAQNDHVADQAARVRTVVRAFGQEKTNVTLLTRSLIVVKGKIVRSREDSFDIKTGKVLNTFPYTYLLEMEGGGAYISFVPERAVRGHGAWGDVGRVYPGTKILVVLADGRSVKGFSNSISETDLIMIDEKGRKRSDIPRDQIASVYGLIGGYGGVKKGASTGAKAMNSGRDKLPGMVFAGVGALVGLAKSDGRPILIYSK